MMPHYPYLCPKPTTETGPNDNNIVQASKCFLNAFCCFITTNSFFIQNRFYLCCNDTAAPKPQQGPIWPPHKHPEPLSQAAAHGVGTSATQIMGWHARLGHNNHPTMMPDTPSTSNPMSNCLWGRSWVK